MKGIIRSDYGVLGYYAYLSQEDVPNCTAAVIEESLKGNVVPILDEKVLTNVIFALIEEHDEGKDITAEFISHSCIVPNQFFTYSFDEIEKWPDCMEILGCVGLVLVPTKKIKLIFPYLHGVGKKRGT